MPDLKTGLQLSDPDHIYQIIIDAHNGLGAAESAKLNTRLVLLLANHVGDARVIEEAVSHAARSTVK